MTTENITSSPVVIGETSAPQTSDSGNGQAQTQEPQLDTWELIRKNPPDGDTSSDDVSDRILANPRPSVWDIA